MIGMSYTMHIYVHLRNLATNWHLPFDGSNKALPASQVSSFSGCQCGLSSTRKQTLCTCLCLSCTKYGEGRAHLASIPKSEKPVQMKTKRRPDGRGSTSKRHVMFLLLLVICYKYTVVGCMCLRQLTQARCQDTWRQQEEHEQG